MIDEQMKMEWREAFKIKNLKTSDATKNLMR